MNQTSVTECGLQSVLFERTNGEGVTEYAYVFAGTNSLEDVAEDVAQLAGGAPQYEAAINNARQLHSELNGAELTFVGHSLGGGLAAASSMATSDNAIAFNRAAVSEATKLRFNLGSERNIKNFITRYNDGNGKYIMEPLSRFQESAKIFGIKFLSIKGRREYVNINKKLSLIEAHKIRTVINHWEK